MQLDINGIGDAFANVYDHPQEAFEGSPNAVIVLDSSESESSTNVENERTDNFIIYAIIPLEDEGVAQSATYDQMYDIIDQLRNGLDRNIDFAGSVLYIDPTAGGISMQETSAGVSLIGEVRVKVRHLYDFITT